MWFLKRVPWGWNPLSRRARKAQRSQPAAKRFALDRLEARELLTTIVPVAATLAKSGYAAAPMTALAANASSIGSTTEKSGDLNGDGKQDVVGLSANGVLTVGISSATGITTERWAFADGWNDWGLADLNGDGRDDVAVFTNDRRWQIGISDGTKLTWSTWAQWNVGNTFTNFEFADFDGDGADDVAGMAADGTWCIGISRGGSFSGFTFDRWLPPSSWAEIYTGDVNADGKADMIGYSKSGTWVVGVSNGESFQSTTWDQWGYSGYYAKVFTGDFDNDGKTDVAGFTTSGMWVVGTAGAGAFNTSIWKQWGSGANWTGVAVADMNGDGFDDFIGMTKQAEWWVAFSNGTGIDAASIWTDWYGDSSRWNSILIADFDGLGRSDLAAISTLGQWAGAMSTGAGFNGTNLGIWASYYTVYSYNGELPPYAPGSPWDPGNKRKFFDKVPVSMHQAMFSNNATTFRDFTQQYLGTLDDWLAEARLEGYTGTQLTDFLTGRLNSFFQTVKDDLAAIKPGLTDNQYRMLMSMNLAHGHFTTYDTSYASQGGLTALLNTNVGDCSEFGTLIAALGRLQGVAARSVWILIDYPTSIGRFYAGHVVAEAEGMLFDGQNNVAFVGTLATIAAAAAPANRLQYVLNNDLAVGFYNYQMKPDIRARQVARGMDGGAILFYYKYYFEGMGQGVSSYYYAE
jgi:hypothetical protein